MGRPVSVDGPTAFVILGVWAHDRRATEFHPLEPKTSQPQQALALYRDLFAGLPLVVAGDFNNNVQWDRPGRAANWVTTSERLADAGLVSAYHEFFGEPFGSESRPTLYWRDRKVDGPRYHIDFCFVPKSWQINAVRVGGFDEGVSLGLSDHVPLVVDLTPDM